MINGLPLFGDQLSMAQKLFNSHVLQMRSSFKKVPLFDLFLTVALNDKYAMPLAFNKISVQHRNDWTLSDLKIHVLRQIPFKPVIPALGVFMSSPQ